MLKKLDKNNVLCYNISNKGRKRAYPVGRTKSQGRKKMEKKTAGKKLTKKMEKIIERMGRESKLRDWELGNFERDLKDIALADAVYVEREGYAINDNPEYYMELSLTRQVTGNSIGEVVDMLNDK